jgi:hypothetical protein
LCVPINQVHRCPIVFLSFLFSFKDIDYAHHQFFWNNGQSPISSTPLAPTPENRSFVMLPFLQFTWKLNSVQTIWHKIEVISGMSWGTCCELDRNTMGTDRKNKIRLSIKKIPRYGFIYMWTTLMDIYCCF